MTTAGTTTAGTTTAETTAETTTAETTAETTTAETATTERRRPQLSFRARVLGFIATLLVGAILAGLVVQRAVLLEGLDDDVDAMLEQEREELEKLALGLDPTTGSPFGDDVAAIFDTFLARNVPVEGEAFLTFVDGVPYKATPAPVRLDANPELVERWTSPHTGTQGEIDTAAGPVRYLAVPLVTSEGGRGDFVIANFLRGERDEIETTVRVGAATAVIVLLVTITLAWVVAGRLLRPVRRLTETARAINDTDLARRIPVEGDDEIAELGHTFNAMLDRLEHAFAAQRAFIDDAGHELRTPITIVRGHLDVMGDDPRERQDTLALVDEELDRMARMVGDLLLLAKAEQPDFVRREVVDVTDFTTEILVKAHALGDRHWLLDRNAEGPAVLDPQRLTQAMLNLVRNAVEHTNPADEIGIGSRWRGNELHVWVRDTGPGVDASVRARIFERFARGRTDGRRSDGAGLGLAIASAIAQAHEGRITLENRPGSGACFTLAIPARTAGSPEEQTR